MIFIRFFDFITFIWLFRYFSLTLHFTFYDIEVGKGTTSLYMMAFNTLYEKYASPLFNSMLMDINQTEDGTMSSVTDDISTTLYISNK